MARKKKDDHPKGLPAWLATFGDLMSLLLTFFILLVSFSTIQESKFHEAMGSLQGALGVMENFPSNPVKPNIVMPSNRAANRKVLSVRAKKIREQIRAQGHQAAITVSNTERGLAIRMDSQFLFDSGRASLRESARPTMVSIAELLVGLPNSLRVEGHTDNLPINSEIFPSNWELSAARASAVIRQLEKGSLDPRRMSAIGYGEWRPVANNDSPEARQENRRVELFLDALPD